MGSWRTNLKPPSWRPRMRVHNANSAGVSARRNDRARSARFSSLLRNAAILLSRRLAPHPGPLPASGSSMHTSQHGMCCAEGFEPSEAVAHGEGSGRTFRGVSFPAAEAGDDPGGPRQGTGGMRVLLLWGSPFESGLVEGEGVDFLGREDLLGRDRRGAVTGADELHDTGRREGAEEGEFDEGLSALDLTGLDVETLALQGPEQLLDIPALAIPLDDVQGIFRGLDRVGCQQPPVQWRWFLARARAALANIDDVEDDAVGRGSSRARGPAQPARAHEFDLAEAHLHSGPAGWAPRLSGHLKLVTEADRQPVALGEQQLTADQRAVLRSAGEQVQVGRTWPGPALVNVGFAIADHRHQFGRAQNPLGRRDRVLPALRFLLPDRPLAACRLDLPAAHPQLGPSQPETALAVRLDRQQRVQKQPLVGAIADRAQPMRAPGMALKIEFGGVLDRQDMMAALGKPTDPLASTPVECLHTHPIIAQKTAELDFLGAMAGQLPQPHRRSLDHALQKKRPPFPAGHPRTGPPPTRPCRPPSQHVAVGTQRVTQCGAIATSNHRVSQNATPRPKDVCTGEAVRERGDPA